MQSVAVYLHVYNCLVIIIEYRLASHAIILKGGAAASETLTPPPKQPRENAEFNKEVLPICLVCCVSLLLAEEGCLLCALCLRRTFHVCIVWISLTVGEFQR